MPCYNTTTKQNLHVVSSSVGGQRAGRSMQRKASRTPEEMNRPKNDDTLSKLMDATNSFHVDDEFESKFKAPPVQYPKFTPENLIKKMASIERNVPTFAREVRFLIKFYLHSTSNSRSDATSEGYIEFQKLMKKYGVDRKVEGDNITLHRIAASFPIVSVSLLRQFKIDRRFSTEMLKTKNAENFPWSMRTQMCLSLVPNSAPHGKNSDNNENNHKIILGIVAYMYYENRVVNEGKKFAPPATVFEKVLNIAHTVYKDSSVEEDKKKNAWYHVAYEYEENKEAVKALLNHFRKEIPDAESVLKNRFGFSTENNFKAVGEGKRKNPHQFSRRFPN